MNAASKMLSQETLEVLSSVTSSLGSQDGLTPWPLPDGRLIDPCGLAAALASLSARQVKELGLRISGIYGPPGSTSSASADLQRSLESRLQGRLSGLGSTLYKLTWKEWATPSGVSRSRLRASARHSSETGSTGLERIPTPSGTSNHGKNHVAGRLDEWGGSSNPWRGTSIGRTHSPAFELSMMGYPDAWQEQMRLAMPSFPSRRRSS